MSISVERFISPEQDSPEYRALEKAIKDSPIVKFIGEVDSIRYYQVTSSKKIGPKYPVRIWTDADGESWVECYCAAAYPPQHPHTKLIAWFEKCCYHIGAVLLFEIDQDEVLPLD